MHPTMMWTDLSQRVKVLQSTAMKIKKLTMCQTRLVCCQVAPIYSISERTLSNADYGHQVKVYFN
jgi:hypothetical protein